MWGAVAAGALGLAWGSFANVLLSRWPRQEPWIRGRSRCPVCRKTIRWYDNLPLLSFFWLRGRCRACGAAIPWRYPLLEAAGGLLFLAYWWRFATDPDLFFFYTPGAALLLLLAVFDLEYWWLPDALIWPALVWALGGALLLPSLRLWEALSGALAGGALLIGVRLLYQLLTQREGLGWGDVKLLTVIGAYGGVASLPFILAVSAGLGSLYGFWWLRRAGLGRLTPVPYGFFLALTAILYFLGAEPLHDLRLMPDWR